MNLSPSTKQITLAVALSAIILSAVFAAGVFIGFERKAAIEQVSGVSAPETGKPSEVDFSLFWKVWARLQEKYVDRSHIDSQKQVWGAISGMVRALGDPYTNFLPPEDTKQFQEDLNGEFGGIGAELGIRKEVLTVITPLKNSPAQRAGLTAGDKIIKIDEEVTTGLSLEGAVRLIRGEKGTPVKLSVLRNGEEAHEFTIIRETIVIPTIETKELGNGVFYIRLFSFNGPSPQIFREAVGEFLGSKNTKLVLDLRGNAGGFLNAAVDIASWFLRAGEVVAREKYGDGSEDNYRSIGRRLLEDIPTVVLIDQGSASASEILAGALRDVRGIKLVGQKSFGKGSVQELVELDDGASLKVTIAKWLTPSGKTIDGEGLEPDVVVEIKKEDTEEGKDPQLDKAVEILKEL
ncbi:MAG: S41 family peptidase [Candidatus Sungbacteria bacterium]|nr:S41 family peptidase [Candidatus Sungbacteria bacterium]